MNSKQQHRKPLWSDDSAVKIELFNPTKCYKPGETVEGRVLVRPTSFEGLEGASIFIQGCFELSKAPREYHKNIPAIFINFTRRIESTAQKFSQPQPPILKQILNELNEYQLEGNQINFLTREHEYPFRFVLPTNIPTSFVGDLERVFYGIVAHVKKELPCKEPTISKTIDFTVAAPFVNPSRIPEYREPVHQSGIKWGNLLIGRVGEIGFSITLPNGSGFVSGESVNFKVEVANDSNVKVTGMKVWIQQIVTEVVGGGFEDKVETRNIAKITGPEVEAKSRKIWMPKDLLIPKVPPTTLEVNHNFVDIQYFLHFKMDIYTSVKPLSTVIPLIIGDAPLKSDSSKVGTLPSAPLSDDTEEMNKEARAMYLAPPPYYGAAGPSYGFMNLEQ